MSIKSNVSEVVLEYELTDEQLDANMKEILDYFDKQMKAIDNNINKYEDGDKVGNIPSDINKYDRGQICSKDENMIGGKSVQKYKNAPYHQKPANNDILGTTRPYNHTKSPLIYKDANPLVCGESVGYGGWLESGLPEVIPDVGSSVSHWLFDFISKKAIVKAYHRLISDVTYKSYIKPSKNKHRIVKEYVSGDISFHSHTSHLRINQPFELLYLYSFEGIDDIGECIRLSRVINSISNRLNLTDSLTVRDTNEVLTADDHIRFTTDSMKAYYSLPRTLQMRFFEEVVHDGKTGIIINRNTNDSTHKMLNEFVRTLDQPFFKTVNYAHSMRVHIKSFEKMSLYSKLLILRNMLRIKGSEFILLKRTKQDIGHFGRQYNIFNEIPRPDRSHIEVYGVDGEAMLQNIVLRALLTPEHQKKATLTQYYIDNKKRSRSEIADLMNITISEAKTLITSIYQGLPYNQKLHKPIAGLFDEVHEIQKSVMSLAGDGTIADKYATKRTNEKMKTKMPNYKQRNHNIRNYINRKYKLTDEDANEIMKSYFFFRWTFVEREVQNILVKHLGGKHGTITLHDGVFTQDIDIFYDMDLDAIEEEIRDSLGFEQPLSIEVDADLDSLWSIDNRGVYRLNNDGLLMYSLEYIDLKVA